MATAPMLGTGGTFTYTGFTGNWMSIKPAGMYEREAIKTSHLGTTGAHTYMPSTLYDAGGCVIEFQVTTGVDYAVPAVAAASSLVITWSAGTTITVPAFMTSLEWSNELETLMIGTATFKFSDDIVLDVTP